MSAHPVSPSPGHYKERRIAAKAITRYLAQLHEPMWADILFDWTRRYDGLESYLYPEEDPVMEVCNLLQQYVEKGLPLEPEHFANALADLRFCYCAARRDEGGLRWGPFQDGSFKAWTCGKIVRVWDSPEPWPTRDMIQAWLLLRFSRTRTRTPLN